MPRSFQVYVPESDFEWYRQALEQLADATITDDEAGQRGAKLSLFIRMLATAYIRDIRATEAAMQAVKRIADGTPDATATLAQRLLPFFPQCESVEALLAYALKRLAETTDD